MRNRRSELAQADPEPEHRDDKVIARAFRRSLLALVLVAVPIAIAVYWTHRSLDQAPASRRRERVSSEREIQ